jgi:hypothetical protein
MLIEQIGGYYDASKCAQWFAMVSLYWQEQLPVFLVNGVRAAKQHSRHLLGLRMLRYPVAYGPVSLAATQPRFKRP